MNKRKRWLGELAKPIRITVNRKRGFIIPDLDDPTGRAKILAENRKMRRLRDEAKADAETKKLALLARHFQVAEDDFRALALALAREFVPGFQFRDPLRALRQCGPQYEEKEKSGRPRLWDPDRLKRLLSDVEALKTNGDLTDREVLERLARRGEWMAPKNHRGGARQWLETLESRLQDAKRLQREAERLQRKADQFGNQLSAIQRELQAEDESANSGNSRQLVSGISDRHRRDIAGKPSEFR